jgi:hypothetical protein
LTIGGNISKTPVKGQVNVEEPPELFSLEWACKFLGYDLLLTHQEESPGQSVQEGDSEDVQPG